MKPSRLQTGPRIVLGTIPTTTPPQPFTLSGWPLKQHKFISGITGQGKSRLIASMCVQLLSEGIPFALIDPHGDLCESVLYTLLATGFFSDERSYKQLWYIPFHREDRHIAFNVLQGPYPPHTIAQNVLEAWKRSWSSSIGDGSATALENVLLASVYTLTINQQPLTSLSRLITDDAWRRSLLPQVTDPGIADFWNRKQATALVESTLRRAFLLSFSPALRYCLGQQENRLPFRSLLDQGISCIYDLSTLDPQTQRFLGALLTLGYEEAALSRSDLPEAKRIPCQVFIDEFSQFCSQSGTALERILTLTRKFGLTLNLACQTLSQTKEIHDALQNTIHLSFKMGYEDVGRIVQGFLDNTPKQADRSFWQALFPSSDTRLVADGQDKNEWVRLMKNLQKQECLVHISGKTWKVKTLGVADVPQQSRELEQIKNRYAQLLLTPRSQIQQQMGECVPQAPAPVVDLASRRTQQANQNAAPRRKNSGLPKLPDPPTPLALQLPGWEDLPDEQ